MLSRYASKTFFKFVLLGKAIATPTAFGVSALVVNKKGQVLLVRHRHQRQWQLPGGGVGRAEAPQEAVLRELAEEIGLTGGVACLFGLYTRRPSWVSNIIALYCVRQASISFLPNLEIEDICFTDPLHPRDGISPATGRRFCELTDQTERSSYW